MNETLKSLYLQELPRLLNMIRRWLDNHEDRMDVAQECFMKAAAIDLIGKGCPEGYLRSIFRNAAFNRLRERGKEPVLLEMPEVVVDKRLGVGEETPAERVHELMATVSQSDREYIEACLASISENGELRFEDVARRRCMSVASAHMAMTRIRKKVGSTGRKRRRSHSTKA